MTKTAKKDLFTRIRSNWIKYNQLDTTEDNTEYGKCLFARIDEDMTILKLLNLTIEYRLWSIEQGNCIIRYNQLVSFCRRYGLYTMGTNEDFDNLLSLSSRECNKMAAIKQIAQDIFDHSTYLDGQTVKDLINLIVADNCIILITY